MAAAVRVIEAAARRGRRTDQQRRVPPVRRDRGASARAGPRAVRDERVRAGPTHAARAAGDARGGSGPDRQRELDGWPPDVPGRRLLPRDASTRSRRSATRCASRSALRHRRRHRRAGPDPHRVRRRGRRVDGRGCRADEGPYDAFNANVAEATHDVYEKGPLAKLGGGPDDVAKTIERAITTKRPKIRYRVTPSAHMLVAQRSLMTDGMWDTFLRTQFQQPGKD